MLDRPSIPDAEYDRMFRELQELEQSDTSLRTADSPTLRIGADAQTQFRKREHVRPMLSLTNAFNDDELRAWEDRLVRAEGEDVRKAGYTAELKIDGTAVSLTYENRLLVAGATRGNGIIGEDVTPNLRTVRDVPLRLPASAPAELMEIRGEIYFPFARFEEMNEARASKGEPLFMNPRNAAAGSLRQLDPSSTASRPLRFFGYSVAAPDGVALPFDTQESLLDTLVSWGVPVAPHRRRCAGLADVEKWAHEVEHTIRGALDFAIDGGVVKVDSLALQDELGVIGGREPRWAIARKFAPDIAETRLLRIEVNVGRTGALNPFAMLEPVEIGGTMVKLATLHNQDLVRRKDLREGDFVQVKRAGDVIPQVIAPLTERRTGSERPWTMPAHCPACGTPAVRAEGEVAIYCPNVACPGRQLEGLVHFASRGAMDIRGLSYARIGQLIEAGKVHDVADLYTLTVETLLELEGYAKKGATGLIEAIATSKKQPLSRLLNGLGIRHVGTIASQLLARQFGDLDKLVSASADEIRDVRGVGDTIASGVAAYFADPSAKNLVEKLRAAGLNFEEPRTSGSSGSLNGKTVVITGTLPTLSRSAATEIVENAGGKVTGTVSKSTSFVVVGTDAGTKLEKAKSLGVDIIDEAELLRRTTLDATSHE